MNPSLESWIDPVALRQLRTHFGAADPAERSDPGDTLIVPDDDEPAEAAAAAQPSAESLAAADALLARFGASATTPPATADPAKVIASVQNAARVAGASEYFLVTPAPGPGRSHRVHCATAGSEGAIEAALGLASAWEQGLRRLGSQVHSALHVDLGQQRQLAILPVRIHGVTHCLGLVVKHALDAGTIERVRGAVAEALDAVA